MQRCARQAWGLCETNLSPVCLPRASLLWSVRERNEFANNADSSIAGMVEFRPRIFFFSHHVDDQVKENICTPIEIREVALRKKTGGTTSVVGIGRQQKMPSCDI